MTPDITPINGDDIPSDEAPNLDGVTLNKDGTPRKRRGRKPGSAAGGTRRTAADRKQVETALATMGTLYSSLSAVLLVVGKPGAAAVMAGGIEQTQAANRQAFEASPALAGAIAKLGAVSSVGLFLGSNIALLGQTLIAIRMETAAQRAASDAAANPEGHTGL